MEYLPVNQPQWERYFDFKHVSAKLLYHRGANLLRLTNEQNRSGTAAVCLASWDGNLSLAHWEQEAWSSHAYGDFPENHKSKAEHLIHTDHTTTGQQQTAHKCNRASMACSIHTLQAGHENNISEASYNNEGNSCKFHSFSFKGNVYENLYRPLVGYPLLYIPLLVYNIHISMTLI